MIPIGGRLKCYIVHGGEATIADEKENPDVEETFPFTVGTDY